MLERRTSGEAPGVLGDPLVETLLSLNRTMASSACYSPSLGRLWIGASLLCGMDGWTGLGRSGMLLLGVWVFKYWWMLTAGTVLWCQTASTIAVVIKQMLGNSTEAKMIALSVSMKALVKKLGKLQANC